MYAELIIAIIGPDKSSVKLFTHPSPVVLLAPAFTPSVCHENDYICKILSALIILLLYSVSPMLQQAVNKEQNGGDSTESHRCYRSSVCHGPLKVDVLKVC